MQILQTEDLKKYYGAGDTEVRALDGVTLSVEEGEFVSIVGTSGSGKSTLLHMLGGLDRPTSGKVFVDGNDIFALKDDELTIFRRRKIGFVFQAYNLVPVLSVYENIVLPIELDGNPIDQTYVQQIVQTLGLESKLDNLPSQLSGGQQQRVAIARALACDPEYILCDEATSALDPASTNTILKLLRDINRTTGVTIIVITHSMGVVEKICRNVVVLDHGRVVEQGSVGEVFANPVSDAAQVLLERVDWDA